MASPWFMRGSLVMEGSMNSMIVSNEDTGIWIIAMADRVY